MLSFFILLVKLSLHNPRNMEFTSPMHNGSEPSATPSSTTPRQIGSVDLPLFYGLHVPAMIPFLLVASVEMLKASHLLLTPFSGEGDGCADEKNLFC